MSFFNLPSIDDVLVLQHAVGIDGEGWRDCTPKAAATGPLNPQSQ